MFSELSGRRFPPAAPEALPPHPIRAVTAPTSPQLIPTPAGGKLREEIGVVPPLSDAALVLECLTGPLPPLRALAPGDLGFDSPPPPFTHTATTRHHSPAKPRYLGARPRGDVLWMEAVSSLLARHLLHFDETSSVADVWSVSHYGPASVTNNVIGWLLSAYIF